jgi:hypothetical protein
MAHYAILNEDDYVRLVIVGKNEDEIVLDDNGNPIDWEEYYGGKRTSYNTCRGVHKLGGTPFRKNYAGAGFKYDRSRDAFIPPRQFPSWLWNEEACMFDAPTPYPTDGHDYYWDEFTTTWKQID